MMFNFFVDDTARQDDLYRICGSDHNHISNVLRMRVGDRLLISDGGMSNLCCIESIDEEAVIVRILEEGYKNAELPIKIYLFQALPKSDKMELIIQKAVELGVQEIIPVEMKRCIVKLDDKKRKSKQTRWQAIAESAAKQSKRNIVPTVREPMKYRDALSLASELELFAVPYENEEGMKATRQVLSEIKRDMTVGILVGPEGGFEQEEIRLACAAGGKTLSLGERILRTETAAITGIAMLMLYAEMNLSEDKE